jgi:cob(I)alamin adenosyltransferase
MAAGIHRGDGGDTQLLGGQRVRKDDLRIECVGGVDELSSFLGLARAVLAAQEPLQRRPQADALMGWLARIQHELYLLGAQLARRDQADTDARIVTANVGALDRDIDETDAALPKLRAFILPGGGVAAAHLHVARAICRRVERQAVALASVEPLAGEILPYLNRLSLALFSMARQAAALAGEPDQTA